jgi:hypothetical protein
MVHTQDCKLSPLILSNLVMRQQNVTQRIFSSASQNLPRNPNIRYMQKHKYEFIYKNKLFWKTSYYFLYVFWKLTSFLYYCSVYKKF